MLHHVVTTARAFVKPCRDALVDALLPPRCLSCGDEVESQGGICGSCWNKLHFIAAPYCPCCGHPFDMAMPEGALCGACVREAPAYQSARSVLVYDAPSRKLIHALKYYDRTELAMTLGRWMARAGAELLEESDLICPVPLHWRRIWSRRYNQSQFLAKELGRLSGLPVDGGLLLRRRHTPPQATLSREQRQRNVRGIFMVNPDRKAMVKGKRVLLVDDVYTTGATIRACTRMLLRAGAAEVRVLTLARTVIS